MSIFPDEEIFRESSGIKRNIFLNYRVFMKRELARCDYRCIRIKMLIIWKFIQQFLETINKNNIYTKLIRMVTRFLLPFNTESWRKLGTLAFQVSFPIMLIFFQKRQTPQSYSYFIHLEKDYVDYVCYKTLEISLTKSRKSKKHGKVT